jgi:capsule polysaccharide modification protein KpsS
MGINLFWEDENGKSLGTVIDDKNLFAHALEKADLNGTICLRFIDRYGDTTFNQLQVPVLRDEIKILKQSVKDLPTLQQIDAILSLIQNSKETHTYLKFYGD